MDLLTHLFLPLTTAYVLRPDLFTSRWHLLLAGFAVMPDVDKLFGLQGVLHAPFVLAVIGIGMVILEQRLRGDQRYALLALALMMSHLVLDFLDGGPVLLLYPFIEDGIGLRYPTELILGDDFRTATVRNPFPTIDAGTPNRSRTSYPLVEGYGLASMLLFLLIYFGEWMPGSIGIQDTDED